MMVLYITGAKVNPLALFFISVFLENVLDLKNSENLGKGSVGSL